MILAFMRVPTLCVRAAMALKKLRICAVSSEPSLLANAMGTKLS